jgi:hypothetical protein
MKTANSTAEILAPSEAESTSKAQEEPALTHLFEHLAPMDGGPEAAAAPDAEAAAAPGAEAVPSLRTARVVSIKGAVAQVTWRGRREPVEADLDDGVDRELVARAMANGDAVLIEVEPGMAPIVVGVIQTKIPDTLELKARSITIDAEQEVLVRAGRGAMRIREDGDVEVVGSRIVTMSRGLFRIVGRVLRLN